MKDVDLKALFLGPKSENAELFMKNLSMLFDDHAQWRKDFHPGDENVIKLTDQEKESYKCTKDRMEEVMTELSSKLRAGSVPWHSPRYLGHMNSETLMPSMLAYFGAMLYNGNNVAYESSPATSAMEQEVGQDFCRLLGYDTEKGWGHICCDGSVANFEGMWYARNFKSLPLAMKEITPELVAGKSDWELLNMSVEEVLDLIDKVPDKWEALKAHSARAVSNEIPKLGKWLVPQTKHYSWLKAADVMGIGTDNIIAIKVDHKYRMDINCLKETIDKLIAEKTPILGVVGVVGTTEEGAVDHIDKIVELKKEYAKQGVNFYFHVDSAYGGYARSIFLDENDKFMDFDELHDKYLAHGVFKNPEFNWPSKEIYEGFKSMSEADSITIDPHKMGYVPYAAGGIAIKDRRMRNAISYFASYVFEKGMQIPALLGAFMLEGSKAGATAASVWVAHKILPLNITGYGQIIGASIEGAYNLYVKLQNQKEYKIGDKIVNVTTLVKPDFNMVDFVFNIKGNTNLADMNELNHKLYDKSSFVAGDLYSNDFITSHTEFGLADYADSPLDFVERCGIPESQWDKTDSVTLIRACVLSPYINEKETFDIYAKKMDESIVKKLEEIIK